MDPHPVWHLLQAHVIKNWEAYLAFFAAVGIAAVCTMPIKYPRSVDDCWDWLRNTLQTAVPAARANHAQQLQVVQTPEKTEVTASSTEPKTETEHP